MMRNIPGSTGAGLGGGGMGGMGGMGMGGGGGGGRRIEHAPANPP